MQTKNDAEIVGWVGRIGAAGAGHLMAQFGVGRSWASHRLNGSCGTGCSSRRRCSTASPGCT